MSTNQKSQDQRHWYNHGWRYSSTNPVATLEYGDSMSAPDAWYDGYLDAAAGRDKWTAQDGTRRPYAP